MDVERDRGRVRVPASGRAALVVGAICVASFGPYTWVAGVRTEQVVVYVFAVGALVSMRWAGVRLSRAAVLVAVLLVTEVGVAAVGALAPVPDLSPYGVGSVAAGLDNLLLPLAVLLSVWSLRATGADRHRLVGIVCRIVLAAMCVNAVVAYWSQIHDLTFALSRFWDNTTAVADAGTDTVAGRSAQLGRYTGIFNQPAEAGEMYSIALLAAIYLYRAKPVRLVAAGLFVAVGGILSVSKVFLLVGLPIGVWQVLRQTTQRGRRVTLLITGVLGAAALAQSGAGPAWSGGNFLNRLLHPGDSAGLLDLYTAGRLGDESSLQPVADAVIHNSPWFGYGAGGLATAYDNAWIEALSVAGLFGVAVYSVLLIVLAVSWIRRRTLLDPPHSRLAGGLVILACAASAGLPALTANRVATILWLLIALLLLTSSRTGHDPTPDRPGNGDRQTGRVQPSRDARRIVPRDHVDEPQAVPA